MYTFEELTLTKLERNDLPLLLALKNESWFGTHRFTIANIDDQNRWFTSLDANNLVLMATMRSDKVGIFKIFNIDWTNRKADVGWDIFLEHRGKGFGKLLVRSGVNFCFEVLNLNRLDAEILSNNKPSARCAIDAGFVKEGTKRRVSFKRDHYEDSDIYGMLSSDFKMKYAIPKTEKATINYVISCWSGDRRLRDEKYIADRTVYLRTHLQCLQKYNHELSQITISIANNLNEPQQFKDFLNTIPDKIGNTKVVIVRRPNVALSYGAFFDAYSQFDGDFDYYIFIEDDYVFIKNNFDEEMVELFQSRPECGLLCGLVRPWPVVVDRRPVRGARQMQRPQQTRTQPHAAVCNGITSSCILREIWNKYNGKIPGIVGEGYDRGETQIAFSNAFLSIGKTLEDIVGKYSVPYKSFNEEGIRVYSSSGDYVHYGSLPKDLPYLMIPIQSYEDFLVLEKNAK